MRGTVFVVATLLVCSACGASGAGDSPAPAEWDGTVTTAGDLTTVVNKSGSVWGGNAVLVEELSIGVLEGAEEYMLGSVSSVAYDGERVIVADRQVPAVRIYDADGTYLSDLGGVGEGPGEYQSPASVVVADDGRILVRDDRGRRILIYAANGDYLDAYRLEGGLSTGTPMQVTPDGTPYTIVIVETLENDPSRMWILGMQAHGPEGPYGEAIIPPTQEFNEGIIVARVEGSTSMNSVPFWPTESWTMTPALDVISGVATKYQFEIRRSDTRQLPPPCSRTRRSGIGVVPRHRCAAWIRRGCGTGRRSRPPNRRSVNSSAPALARSGCCARAPGNGSSRATTTPTLQGSSTQNRAGASAIPSTYSAPTGVTSARSRLRPR